MKSRRLVTLAWKSLWMHPLRSLLTVLGIVCGVMSVVTMLAVGEGASQEAQEQIRRMGSRNLLVSSVAPASSESAADANSRVLAYGILNADQREKFSKMKKGRKGKRGKKRGRKK